MCLTYDISLSDNLLMSLADVVHDAGYVDYYAHEYQQRGAELEIQLDQFAETNVDRFIEARVFTRHLIKR